MCGRDSEHSTDPSTRLLSSMGGGVSSGHLSPRDRTGPHPGSDVVRNQRSTGWLETGGHGVLLVLWG